MTRYDRKISAFILAAVVALGLARGYSVGNLSRGEVRTGLSPLPAF